MHAHAHILAINRGMGLCWRSGAPDARRAVSCGAAARVNLVRVATSTACRKMCRMDMPDLQPSRLSRFCNH